MMHDRHSTDGLFKGNAVLSGGMVIAPLVVCCDTLGKALMVALAFACLTILTVGIGSFYPRRFPYAVRVLLYALTAALLYIPTALLCEFLAPDCYAAVHGLYLPLLSVNSFIVLHSELYFYRLPRRRMLVSLLFHSLGFAMAACAAGIVRELAAYGCIAGHVVDMPLVMRFFGTPGGGFLTLALLCALYRVLTRKRGGDAQ